MLLIGSLQGVQPGFLHVMVQIWALKTHVLNSPHTHTNLPIYMCAHVQIQVEAAGSWPLSLVINQMSQPNENTIPCHNLGNNTHCHRNLMRAWERPIMLKEGKKTQPWMQPFKFFWILNYWVIKVSKTVQIRSNNFPWKLLWGRNCLGRHKE